MPSNNDECQCGYVVKVFTDLVTNQLIYDTKHLFWEKRFGHIVELLQFILRIDATTVHLGIHDLGGFSVYSCDRRWYCLYLKSRHGLKKGEKAIFDNITRCESYGKIT